MASTTPNNDRTINKEAHQHCNNFKDDKQQMATPVLIEPTTLQVPAAGGTSAHQLTNSNQEVRYVFKIKTTNNEHYRVNPVFGIIEPGAAAQVEVTRLEGPPKNDDRLEILFLPVDAECTDPKAPFAGGQLPEFKQDVPMVAE